MPTTHFERLSAAKQRLTAALTAGEDSAPHRAAISAIERDIQTATDREQQAKQEHHQSRTTIAATRAARIAAQARQRIAASIPKAPTKPRSI